MNLISYIKNTYYDFYFYASTRKLNPDNLKFLKERIKQMSNDLFNEKPTTEEVKKLKYKVIVKLKQNKIKNPYIKSDIDMMVFSLKNVQNQIYMKRIPNNLKLTKLNQPDLNDEKIKYIKLLEKSKKEEDKDTLKFLKNEKLKSLSYKFDDQMTNKDLSIRDFAKMLIECNNEFYKILSEVNEKGEMIGGADQIYTICQAFFLLQTNTIFSEALKELLKKCTEEEYSSLVATITPYFAGIASLSNPL